MKSTLSIISNFVTKYRWYFVGVIVITILGYLFFGRGSGNSSKDVEVRISQGTLEEVVSVTGRVKAAQDVDLAFERGGIVRSVSALVGSKVYQGQVLATISSGGEQGRLLEAQAALDAAKVTLEQLKRGARPEEIALKKTAVQQAQADLTNLYSNVPDVLRSAYTNTSDAVRVKLSAFFEARSGNSYHLTFQSCDAQLEINTLNLRSQTEQALATIQNNSYTLVGAPQETIDDGLAASYSALVVVSHLIDTTNDLLSVPCALSNTSLDTYRSQVTLARTALNQAMSDVSLKRNTISSQKIVLQRANEDLTLTNAGTETEKIQAQEFAVKQATAKVTEAESDIRQTIIVAPFAGTVTKVDAKVGQYASPSIAQISMISDTRFEIEAKVPEVDVAKVHVGNQAQITLDAYGPNVIFDGVVASVDPAETIADGVPTYKTNFVFAKTDDRVKSGMTANIDVVTNTRQDVLSVPARALQVREDGKRFVIVKLDNNTTKEVDVTTGIRGKNGNVEIEGDELKSDQIILTTKPEAK